jgi:hypothetical protein
MAKTLNERGQNLAADHVATAIVRTVLGELGLTEELGDEYRKEREELVKIITPCITAAKNFQCSYLAKTLVDGKPLMPEVKSSEKGSSAEFA